MVKTQKEKKAPFLSKCYDMVNDPGSNHIISWGSTDTSFIIRDMIAFEKELLPKYYKHSNFSSFMRQLNIYGFKKCDPDRWEFTNNGFIKGQKQFLKIIPRRKSSQLNSKQNQSDQTDTSPSSCVEVESFGPWEEVEILKKDKNVVMQELAILRHNQQGADGKLHLLGQRLQGMEISQQQMLSFLAMVVQSPGFLGQLLQQNESNWRISGTNKKRPFIALEQGTEGDEPVASDGQIVRYQPLIHNWDGFQQYDHSPDGLDDLFENNDMVSEEHMPVPMEEDGNFEKEGQFVFPDLLEDGMLEKLLLASPSVETTEQSQNLDRLTEELRLLVSETNNPDGEI